MNVMTGWLRFRGFRGFQTIHRVQSLSIGLAGSLLLVGLWSCAVSNTWAENSPSPDASSRPDAGTDRVGAEATPPPAVIPALDARLVAAQNGFGFQLFSQVARPDTAENVMISPSSVAIALSMAYNGATGETQQAMADALNLQGMSLEEVNQANSALEVLLENADPEVTIGIANSLWGREGFAFDPQFLQRNQDFYNAEVQQLNFADPAAIAIINEWVSDSTAGKIPTIVEQIAPEQVLFLINAVYFNGTWAEAFNPRQTQERPFTLASGASVEVPMMRQQGSFRYLETEQFQAIHLPYGSGRLSMVVVLPQAETGLADLQASLTAENWQTWMTRFSPREGTLQLPRFKSEFGTSLNEALQALGMGIAFDPAAADFAGINPDEQLFISAVEHRTFIEVNEQGTEAAAATSIGISVTSAPIDPPFQMVCDRPFFYAIQDNETGAILFMGAIQNPML